jgi:SNF2 family DNA or RNA helicase
MFELCKEITKDLHSVLYTGQKSTKQRVEILKEFQENPDCKIFYASDAGGVGLDGLQLVSNRIAHMEQPWNPSKADQRTGRVYRTLQKNPVTCYYFVSNGDIEQRIKNVNEKKRGVRKDVLSGFE